MRIRATVLVGLLAVAQAPASLAQDDPARTSIHITVHLPKRSSIAQQMAAFL
jgi:hypothetical protein